MRKEIYKQLDEALNYLVEQNRGSFLRGHQVPLKTGPSQTINFWDKLTEMKIDDKYHLPILLHLEEDGYVQSFYKTDEDRRCGIRPDQFKPTYRGIIFSQEGGYSKDFEKRKKIEEKEDIIRNVSALKNQYWLLILIGSNVATIIGTVIITLLTVR